ncbi:type II secretion system protein [Candidatus Saccharibacteria bacterium]|nr:type II secretion system protein [Candidatus Saccharibacteria bacterium]
MKQTTSGFTIVELLITIVVIGIIASITLLSFSNVQVRANDAVIRQGARQIEIALVRWVMETGLKPLAGNGSSAVVSNDTCPGIDAVSNGNGWAASGQYTCSVEDLLYARNLLPFEYMSRNMPANNKVIDSTNKRINFMLYPCAGAAGVTANKWVLYWALVQPSSTETSNLNASITECGNTPRRDTYGMRAAKIIQL